MVFTNYAQVFKYCPGKAAFDFLKEKKVIIVCWGW